MRAAAAALALLLAACLPSVHKPAAPASLLAQVPFFPQEDFQCGPAALATVLVASGVQVQPADLIAEVYLPARRGSLQTELIASARRHGRVPYGLNTLEHLHAALQAGFPVLLLQNLGLRRWPTWHYAVLVGYDPERGEFILRSGREPMLRMSAARFEASWSRAEYWARVMVPPEQPPPWAQADQWIAAVAVFEELRQPQIAERAYAAAVQRWPQSALSWQALGNARHALGKSAEAIAAYRAAIELQPSAASYNNLAYLLAAAGCPLAAQAALKQAESQPDANVYAQVLAQTRTGLQMSLAEDPAACAP